MDGLNRWGLFLMVAITVVVLAIALILLGTLVLALIAAGQWLWGVIF